MASSARSAATALSRASQGERALRFVGVICLPCDIDLRLGSFAATLRSPRRRLAVFLLVVAVSGLLVATHSAPTMEHMDKATAVCLAVLGATGLVAADFGGVLEVRRRPDLRLGAPLPGFRLARTIPPPARAGPLALQVLRL